MSESLWPHELQHTRPPYPSPSPGIHSNSRPSSRWCHPAISFSVVPFSSCPQSLPASEPFPMSQLFAWGGQSTGVSASASFLPKKAQGWSSEWTGWISLQSKGLSRVFSNTTVQKHQAKELLQLTIEEEVREIPSIRRTWHDMPDMTWLADEGRHTESMRRNRIKLPSWTSLKGDASPEPPIRNTALLPDSLILALWDPKQRTQLNHPVLTLLTHKNC